MDDTKRYGKDRQLPKGGYLQSDRAVPEMDAGASSILSMSQKEEDGGQKYQLLEDILKPANLNKAYKKVKAKGGSPGIDGMTTDMLYSYLKQNGKDIAGKILKGNYKPSPVRKVDIPKPDGGTRSLGIPTALDRVIQQAIAQILIPIYEKKFSDSSYGFRPGKSAKQAVEKAREYIQSGYSWTVDIDLAKYFDTVNHDRLVRTLSYTIGDSRVISLIRKYLVSGVMAGGVVTVKDRGTPQGGNLSPLLANIVLDELDKELEKRNLKFVRYADDINIYVKSRKAAQRVMASITRFIEDKLRLAVNKDKSSVDRPWKLKFLGFSFYRKKEGTGIRVHPKSIARFKSALKKLTSRSNAMSISYRLYKLRQLIIGWVNYYSIADMIKLARDLDEWLRRRIRMCYWKQWKKIRTRHKNLVKRGIDKSKAWEFANTRKGYWRIAGSPILTRTFTNEDLERLGFQSIAMRYSFVH